MIEHNTHIPGVQLIEIEPHYDKRGYSATLWSAHMAHTLTLDEPLTDLELVFTRSKGCIRGLHYQNAMHDNARLVRCLQGAVFFVVVDLRSDSPCYLQHYGFPLRHDKHQALLIPKGMAHGFQTLENQCEILFHTPANQAIKPIHGIRWNDQTLAIDWPMPPSFTPDYEQQTLHGSK